MSQTSEIDTINPSNTDNIRPQSPEIMEATHIEAPDNHTTTDNYSTALHKVKELSPRDQHKLIMEILDSQGDLGHKFIIHLHQKLQDYLNEQEEINDSNSNRKRRNTSTIDDARIEINKTVNTNQASSSNQDQTNQSINTQVSSKRPPFSFPPRTQPTDNTTPLSQQNNNQPHNFFPGATDKIKVPPITVVKHETYLAINDLAKAGKFKILYCKTDRNDAIKIFPATIDDYRAITNTLENNNQEFISRNIDDEKLLKVVLRGVPKFADVNEIANELIQQGFEIRKADRMYKKHPDGSRSAYSLVLLQLVHSNHAKEIYNIRHVNGFAITVETKKTTHIALQCHNCQGFGHNQSACRVNPRCHRCAGAHHFTKCSKPITTPATCCNCGGSHPANFTGCPRYPKSPNPLPQQHNPRIINHPSPVQRGISYSQSLSNNTDPLINAITQLQHVLATFITPPSAPNTNV